MKTLGPPIKQHINKQSNMDTLLAVGNGTE